MKTHLKVLVAFGLLALVSCATEFEIMGEDVPQAVQSAFKAKYPTATDVEWEVEKSDGRLVFEAEFKQDGKRKEAEFKADGTFVKEE